MQRFRFLNKNNCKVNQFVIKWIEAKCEIYSKKQFCDRYNARHIV